MIAATPERDASAETTGRLPKIHAHPDDEAEKYLADTFEPDDSAVGVGYQREHMIDAYHAGWDRARELTASNLAEPKPAPDHAVEIGHLRGALADIMDRYPAGTFAHDTARTELNRGRCEPPSEPVTGQMPEPGKPASADQFGGHEFACESHTDLFRCVKCHRYEATARREDGSIEPCAGQPPADSAPIEVNAW